MLTIENGHAIADDLAVLRMYHRLGVRSLTLTHFRNNNWADSSTDKTQHNGLTGFGREVVRETNRIGMIVDISHVSDKTFKDVKRILGGNFLRVLRLVSSRWNAQDRKMPDRKIRPPE